MGASVASSVSGMGDVLANALGNNVAPTTGSNVVGIGGPPHQHQPSTDVVRQPPPQGAVGGSPATTGPRGGQFGDTTAARAPADSPAASAGSGSSSSLASWTGSIGQTLSFSGATQALGGNGSHRSRLLDGQLGRRAEGEAAA